MSNTTVNENNDSLHLTNAWHYFQIHAEQRLRTFQFYVTISIALIGGGVWLAAQDEKYVLIVITGLLIVFVTFVFAKIERRCRLLVKNGEDAIKYFLELSDLPNVNGLPHPFKLFQRDDALVKKEPKGILGLRHFSYRRYFLWIFLSVAMIGVYFVVYGIVGWCDL